jgi:hypothetical protein
LLNAEHWNVLKGAHGIALERGVKEDSPEYFGFLHSLLNQQAAASPPPHAAPAPPPPPTPPVHEPMPPPPMTHIDLEKVESPEGEPETTHMSAIYGAPVSRGDHGHAIEPEPTMGTIKLSPQEREIARMSGGEELYARNKLKMMKLKKASVIKDE